MIDGKAIAKFGTGDILITPSVSSDFQNGHIVLQNKGTHAIGEYSPTKYFKREPGDTILEFSNIDSLNVMIERLVKLRDMMSGNVGNCELGET